MTTVDIPEAKTKLVEALESGAESEIIISLDGKPAVRLVPLDFAPPKKRRPGLASGKYPPLDFEAFQAMDAQIERMFLGEEDAGLEEEK